MSIKAEFFGLEWANSDDCDQDRFKGVISKWNKKSERTLYILWEGWDRNKSQSISYLMGNDENGDSFDFKLEPYEDGRPAPVYVDEEPAVDGEASVATQGAGGLATGGGTPAAPIPGDESDEDAADEAPTEVRSEHACSGGRRGAFSKLWRDGHALGSA